MNRYLGTVYSCVSAAAAIHTYNLQFRRRNLQFTSENRSLTAKVHHVQMFEDNKLLDIQVLTLILSGHGVAPLLWNYRYCGITRMLCVR